LLGYVLVMSKKCLWGSMYFMFLSVDQKQRKQKGISSRALVIFIFKFYFLMNSTLNKYLFGFSVIELNLL